MPSESSPVDGDKGRLLSTGRLGACEGGSSAGGPGFSGYSDQSFLTGLGTFFTSGGWRAASDGPAANETSATTHPSTPVRRSRRFPDRAAEAFHIRRASIVNPVRLACKVYRRLRPHCGRYATRPAR
jgi:hypothetical protein